jgi:hypothetical protein
MTLSSILRSIRLNALSYGGVPAAYDVVVRGLNKCVYYRTMQCLVIERVQQSNLALPPHLRFVKMEEQDLMAMARNPKYETEIGFVRRALGKGDECYGIMDGSTVASYGWYAQSNTSLDPDDLTLHFDSKYVYMYKGFTLHSYRGQRLHAIGMSLALMEYQSRGFKGLVSYVESNNFDSLNSCRRMGYRDCGRIRIMRIAGKYLIRTQPECRSYGIALRVGCSRSSVAL